MPKAKNQVETLTIDGSKLLKDTICFSHGLTMIAALSISPTLLTPADE
ncbi:MAG: hypothetical protein KJ614_07385 [Gammaproteobacteria bacterium]|nr:hypothetical protein [Gammaproteobacteria bacterium]MBU3996571.1 hypothetical protein [Gammaproteobacteria bacterium]MBU4112860.1 hypothetical protein [Gammaproteobacteria bacterium]MBU4173215.1 hypothetical protein [Gammaproteobacteria bacterium]